MLPRRSSVAALLTTVALLSGCTLLVPATQQLSRVDAAADAQAKSDIATAKVAFVSFEVEKSASPTTAAELADFGYSQSDGASLVRIFPGSSAFSLCLDVQSSTGSYFKVTSDQTVIEGECSASDL